MRALFSAVVFTEVRERNKTEDEMAGKKNRTVIKLVIKLLFHAGCIRDVHMVTILKLYLMNHVRLYRTR